MDPNTGGIFELKVTDEEAKEQGLVPVVRRLTEKEHMTKQIELYSPCACGSGKKFKFCCKKAPESFKPVGLLNLFPMIFKKERKAHEEMLAAIAAVDEGTPEITEESEASANVG
jgi:hypothetical protein